MNIQCRSCIDLHFSAVRAMVSSVQTKKDLKCCQERVAAFSCPQESPLLLRYRLTAFDSIRRALRINVRAYNNFFATDCIKADWVSRGPKNSSFSPTMTLHGRICCYLGAFIPPSSPQLLFLFLYSHNTDYATQSGARATQMPNLNFGSLTRLMAMLHECNHNEQSISALQDWATTVNALNSYHLIIHSNHSSATEQVDRYSGPQAFGIAATFPDAADGIAGRRDISIRQREELSFSGTEPFGTIHVTSRA